MKIIKDIQEMNRLTSALRVDGKRMAFVPTMGFLHEGHLSLVREGKKRADLLVSSIYVNPAQFNDKNDFDAYPSNLERDVKLLEGEGCHFLFLPSSQTMYPEGFQTAIDVTQLSKGMCGDSRPGHFTGVATVVAKLFNIVRPHVAIFGEKDFQQLALIKRMVMDLNFDVEIVGMPIVRESDGLAMSSRNVRLGIDERERSLSLSKALAHCEQLYREGTKDAGQIIAAARGILLPGMEVEYIDIRDVNTLLTVEKIEKESLLAIAARVGNTRLIDNIILKEN